jgi:4-amino-4-deoxy-L-arabinose transferase-like glycosyltransferase
MLSLPAPRWFWLLAVGALLYQLPFVLLGEQRDAGELLVAAQQLLRGQLVYTSGYMPKTPGVPYLLAGVFILCGPHLLAARAAVVVANLVGAWAVVALTSTLGWRGRTAFLAGILYLFAAPQHEGAQILTEPFLVPFAVLAPLLLLLSLQTRRLGWAILAGAGVAAALWMKQVGILVLFPLLLLLGIIFLRTPQRRWWITLLTFVFLGSCALTVSVLVRTAVGPQNREAFWNCVVLGLLTRKQPSLLESSPLSGVGANPGLWVPALLLVGIAIVRRPKTEEGGNGPFWLLGGLMLFSLLPVAHRSYPHYYLPALPFAAILSAVFWDATARHLVPRHRGLFVPILLAGLIMPVFRLWQVEEDLRRGATVFADLRVGQELRQRIDSRPVLVLGYDPQYYFLLRAAPPTPHLYLLEENLRLSDPTYPGDLDHLFQKCLDEIAGQHNYDFILTFSGNHGIWGWWPEDRQDEWQVVARFPVWLYETYHYENDELCLRRRKSARPDP